MNKQMIEKNFEKILHTVKIECDVTDVAFGTWLKPLKIYDVKDNVVRILVKNIIEYCNSMQQKAGREKEISLPFSSHRKYRVIVK